MVKSKIKDLMEEKGMTFAALEKLTGCSSQTITRARGEMIRECRLSTLEAIARALSVKIADLFEESSEEEQ